MKDKAGGKTKNKQTNKTGKKDIYVRNKFKSLLKAHATVSVQKLDMHTDTKIHSTRLINKRYMPSEKRTIPHATK